MGLSVYFRSHLRDTLIDLPVWLKDDQEILRETVASPHIAEPIEEKLQPTRTKAFDATRRTDAKTFDYDWYKRFDIP